MLSILNIFPIFLKVWPNFVLSHWLSHVNNMFCSVWFSFIGLFLHNNYVHIRNTYYRTIQLDRHTFVSQHGMGVKTASTLKAKQDDEI